MPSKKIYKFYKLLALCMIQISLVCGCFRREEQVHEVSVPSLRSPQCFEAIERSLRATDGVDLKKTTYDIETKVVRVAYLSTKLSRKNVEFAISDAGFEANGVPAKAEAQAALGEDCR